MKQTVTTLLFGIFLLWTFPAFAQTDARLQERAEKFWSLYTDSHFDEMWEMLSTRLRTTRLKDKKEYVRDLAVSHIPDLKAEILAVKIKENRALVTYKMMAWNPLDKKWVIAEKDSNWVYENDNWYFDDTEN